MSQLQRIPPRSAYCQYEPHPIETGVGVILIALIFGPPLVIAAFAAVVSIAAAFSG